MAVDPPAPDAYEPPLVRKLRAKRDHHRHRSRIVRVLYVLMGFAVLGAGIATLVTPGPAFVIIPVGLAILSLEFAWAEALLERAIEEGDRARRRAAETTRLQRVLTALGAALAAAAVAVWAYYGDIPLAPV